MAVDNPNVIDVVSVDRTAGEAVLIIADHLDWIEGEEADHLLMLQEKINVYASCIGSGELESVYPNAKGHRPVIHVACMNKPTPTAVRFFDLVNEKLHSAGIRFSYRHSHFNSPPQKL